jgi:S1-C subfamily serine protease
LALAACVTVDGQQAALDPTQAAAGSGSAALCPQVLVRKEAAGWRQAVGTSNTTANTRYIGTLGQLSRECRIEGNSIVMRVNVEGRLAVGPRGGPGVVQVPLRIAVIDEGAQPKPVWSKVYNVPVTVAPGAFQTPFTQVEENVTFTLPPDKNIDKYVVYVGFDPAGAAAARLPSRGTGFFVSADGRVLTNAHVVDNCKEIVLHTPGKVTPGRIVARDVPNDLALLDSDVRSARFANFRTSAKLGEDIVVYGYPLSGVLASGGNVTTGNISALTGMRDDSRILQISAPVQAGNSGGPLLDRSGNVIGVVTGKLNALVAAIALRDMPQNVNFAIKSQVVANFLDAQGVKYSRKDGGGTLNTVDLAARAKAYTIQIECKRG